MHSSTIMCRKEGDLPMKYTDVQDLIRAHYKSEDDFHKFIERPRKIFWALSRWKWKWLKARK